MKQHCACSCSLWCTIFKKQCPPDSSALKQLWFPWQPVNVSATSCCYSGTEMHTLKTHTSCWLLSQFSFPVIVSVLNLLVDAFTNLEHPEDCYFKDFSQAA